MKHVSLLNFHSHSPLDLFLIHFSLAYLIPPKSNGEATVIHGLSAASAGAIATLATHPFDVIKVGRFLLSSRVVANFGSFFYRPKCRYAPKIAIMAFSGLSIQYGRWVVIIYPKAQ